MPKLTEIHKPQRIKEHIEKMERGEEVEAKKDLTLLNEEQQQKLKEALEAQRVLKKNNKRPKTEEEKKKIGWKEIREVRIEIYREALAELEENILDIQLKQLEKEQAKATGAYLKGYFGATEGQDKDSAGRIAMTRAGFNPNFGRGRTRDKEADKLEEQLRKQFENGLDKDGKEQLELLREHEKAVAKRKK